MHQKHRMDVPAVTPRAKSFGMALHTPPTPPGLAPATPAPPTSNFNPNSSTTSRRSLHESRPRTKSGKQSRLDSFNSSFMDFCEQRREVSLAIERLEKQLVAKRRELDSLDLKVQNLSRKYFHGHAISPLPKSLSKRVLPVHVSPSHHDQPGEGENVGLSIVLTLAPAPFCCLTVYIDLPSLTPLLSYSHSGSTCTQAKHAHTDSRSSRPHPRHSICNCKHEESTWRTRAAIVSSVTRPHDAEDQAFPYLPSQVG